MLAHPEPVRPETKRPDIERAALELFVKRGLRGTTVRDIATRAGVAEGTLYRHWRSKRELARAIFRGCAEAVADAVRREAAPARDAASQLAAAIRALFRSARDETLLYEMLVMPPSRETQDFLDDVASPALVLAEIIQGGQLRRELDADVDPRLVAECIVGAVNRVAVQRRLGTLPRRLAEYERELTAAVLAALERRPGGVAS
jgi:AcrR family transcriptional regulator